MRRMSVVAEARMVVRVGLAGLVGVAALGGCGAARDIKDAAQGLKDAGKDAKELQAKLDRAKGLEFTAVYEAKSKDGKVEQLTIAQKPPKSSYRQAGSSLIDDGQRLVSCTEAQGAKAECLEVGPHTDAGLFGYTGAGFSFAFNPVTFIGLYEAAAIVPGVEAGKSTRDIAGQKSDCVSITVTRGNTKGDHFEGCTTADGVFSYSDDGDGNVVTLQRFDKRADESAFTFPATPRTQADLLADATSTTASSSTSSTSSSTTSTTEGSSTTSTEPDTTTSSEPDTTTTNG